MESYYERNKEKILERMRIYREENRGRIQETQKQKYHNDEEYRKKRGDYAKRYQKENREKINETKRKYYSTKEGKKNIVAAQKRYRKKLFDNRVASADRGTVGSNDSTGTKNPQTTNSKRRFN